MSHPCPACVTAIRTSTEGDLVECHAECLQAIAAPIESLRVVERVRETWGHWRDQQAEACLCGGCDVLDEAAGECPAVEAIRDVLDDFEFALEAR